MTHTDVIQLGQQLHDLYGERFPGLTRALAVLWLDDLRNVDPQVMDQALTRWARQHHVGQSPTLQNLVDMVEIVENDWRAAAAFQRHPTGRVEPEATLMVAAAHAPPSLRDWVQGHMQLVFEGLGRPSNHQDTAARCREFATVWPMDAQAWERVECWWEQGANGACVLPQGPGEEG